MRLLILGTGGMAAQHAKHFAAIEGVTLVGGVDVDPGALEKFNTRTAFPNGFASLEAALAWGEFDAVANVTPDRSIIRPRSRRSRRASTCSAKSRWRPTTPRRSRWPRSPSRPASSTWST